MHMLALAGFLLAIVYPFSAGAVPSGILGETVRVSVPGEYPTRDVPIPRPELLGPERPADPGLPATPPPNPEVGDSWLWWLFYHYPMPPHFEQKMCTVRGKTDRGYVVVEDSQWGVNMFQNDVDMILERWENSSLGIHSDMGIYDINSLYFGEPPDELDEDPRIYIMWFDIGSAGDGFFFYFDEYPDGTFSGFPSNECETIYLNSAGSQSPSSNYMIAVAAHEFEHMIHWKYDEDEATWVDEGLAEFAMYLYGYPDNITSFPSNPDNNLTNWDGNWADYIKTYLWTLYFYEHYGELDAVWDVVHEPANGTAGYDSVLTQNGYSKLFSDVFLDWVVANFLDDEEFQDGLYGYEGEELPSFNRTVHETYPVGPLSRGVDHWAADYVLFRNGTDLSFSFDGSDNNVFALRTIESNTGVTLDVGLWNPGAGQAGSFDVTDFGISFEDAVIVITSVSNSGSSGYYYSANASPPGIPPVSDLACSVSGTDVILTWSPRPGAWNYALYMDQAPFFRPDQVAPVNLTATTYTHAGAVLPGATWFYIVRGQNGLTQSIDSNRIGAWSSDYDIP